MAEVKEEVKPEEKVVEKAVEKPTEPVEKTLADFEDEPEEKPVSNWGRFKEIDESYDSEDKIFEAVKTLRQEKENLTVAAQGYAAIDEDTDIKSLRSWKRKSDDELFVGSLATEYMEGGKPESEAIEKAREKLKQAKEKDPEAIELAAMRVRKTLNERIAEKEGEIKGKIDNARKSLKPEDDTELFNQVKANINNIEEFLGMKIGADADARKKVYSKAEKLLDKSTRAKLLKDPQFLADAFFYHANKGKFAKAVSERGTTSTRMIDKLDKAPAVTPPKPIKHLGDKEAPKGKMGKDFGSKMR